MIRSSIEVFIIVFIATCIAATVAAHLGEMSTDRGGNTLEVTTPANINGGY